MLTTRPFRLLHASARLANRHPKIAVTPDAYDGEGKAIYDKEFESNYEKARRARPWFPEHAKKREIKARETATKRDAQQDKLRKLQGEVEKFIVKEDPVAVAKESKPEDIKVDLPEGAMHPDYVEEFKMRMQIYRQKYALELEQKLKKQQQEKASASEAKNARNETSVESEEAKATHQFLAIHEAQRSIYKNMMRRLKFENHVEHQKQISEEKERRLTRLYHDAKNFIAPSDLESAIDKCLSTTSPSPSIPRHVMDLMYNEQRKAERELKLFDVLNDTQDGEPNAETLKQTHQKAFEAVSQ